MKSEIITSVVAAVVLNAVLVYALPTPDSKKTKGSKIDAGSITLTFPKDKSFGKLKKVTAKDNILIVWPSILQQARGDVTVPKDTKLCLELSYYAAEDPSLLLKVTGNSIVVLDCRHLGNLTDQGVSQIIKMPGLLSLSLDDTDISDKSLESISHVTTLTELLIQETDFTSKGLARLGALTSLRKLFVAVTLVGDSALPSLTTLQKLTFLRMNRAGISDIGLKSLAKLEKLVALDVSMNEAITDAGIAQLVTLQNLQELTISDTGVTICCLPYLKKMKSLQRLIICDCKKITNADGLRIKHELPRCNVSTTIPPRFDPSVFHPLH